MSTEKIKLSAQQIYDKLIDEDKTLQLTGQIRFYLGDVDIIVKQKDVVGNIIQEWLQGWLDKRKIEYAPSQNTQMPPDFFLDKADRTKNLLEVKAFNRKASPGFDIADFRMYSEENHCQTLHAGYGLPDFRLRHERRRRCYHQRFMAEKSMGNYPTNGRVGNQSAS